MKSIEINEDKVNRVKHEITSALVHSASNAVEVDWQKLISALYETLDDGIKEEPTLFEVFGYWKDDKTSIDGSLISASEEGIEIDDRIFFYGLSEDDIIDAVNAGEDTELDFVITNYNSL